MDIYFFIFFLFLLLALLAAGGAASCANDEVLQENLVRGRGARAIIPASPAQRWLSSRIFSFRLPAGPSRSRIRSEHQSPWSFSDPEHVSFPVLQRAASCLVGRSFRPRCHPRADGVSSFGTRQLSAEPGYEKNQII